jgi:hypothetical protein
MVFMDWECKSWQIRKLHKCAHQQLPSSAVEAKQTLREPLQVRILRRPTVEEVKRALLQWRPNFVYFSGRHEVSTDNKGFGVVHELELCASDTGTPCTGRTIVDPKNANPLMLFGSPLGTRTIRNLRQWGGGTRSVPGCPGIATSRYVPLVPQPHPHHHRTTEVYNMLTHHH